VTVSPERIGDGLVKLTIEVINETRSSGDARDRNSALFRSFISAHTILSVSGAEFVSLLDPPEHLRDVVSGCKNLANFPVLLGEDSTRDMMLCSSILLYDFPQIAPESAGDFYDATEMDEMLTLRVMTLTDEEKTAMRSSDDRVRELLQRTEDTAREQLMRTHGTIRSLRPSTPPERKSA
jgi:hydrogenase maturation protease